MLYGRVWFSFAGCQAIFFFRCYSFKLLDNLYQFSLVYIHTKLIWCGCCFLLGVCAWCITFKRFLVRWILIWCFFFSSFFTLNEWFGCIDLMLTENALQCSIECMWANEWRVWDRRMVDWHEKCVAGAQIGNDIFFVCGGQTPNGSSMYTKSLN